MGDNELTGSLPATLSSMTQLEHLILENNNIVGDIPTQVSRMVELKTFDLDNNQITSVPRDVSRMAGLETFSVQSNSITGTIHTEFGLLVNLQGLFLGENEFAFQIPSELGLLTSLRDGLDVSDNQLIGSIPTELGLLSELSKYRATVDCILATADTDSILTFSLSPSLSLSLTRTISYLGQPHCWINSR